MDYPNRLYELRVSLRKSQGEMANILNISQSEYSRLEKGKRRLGVHEVPLKKYFVEHNVLDQNDSLVNHALATSNENFTQWKNDFDTKFDNEKPDLPVYGIPLVSGGIQWTKEAIDMTARTPLLKNNKEAYVTNVAGDDMKPRLIRGNKALIDPTSPHTAESLVLVEFTEQENVRYFREFLFADDKFIHLKVYNPEAINQYKHSEIKSMHKVFSVRL